MAEKKLTLFEKLESEKIPGSNQNVHSSRYSLRVKIVIFVVSMAIFTFFFSFHFNINKGQTFDANIVSGNIWSNQSMKAEFSFPIYKDDATYFQEKKLAREKALPVFKYDDSAEELSGRLLDSLIRRLAISSKTTPAKNVTDGLANLFAEKAAKDFFKVNYDLKSKEFKNAEKYIRKILANASKNGLIDTTKLFLAASKELSVRPDANTEKIIQAFYVNDLKSLQKEASAYLRGKVSESIRPVLLEIIQKIYRPNFRYSPELTDKEKELAEKSVARTEGIIHQGELIIAKGQKVTDESMKIIKSYRYSRFITSEINYSLWMILGSFGHAALIYSILMIYLYIIRKKIFYDNVQVGLLSFCVLIVAFIAWLSIEIPSKFPIEYIIILPSLSMLTAIVFDSRTAFYSTVTMSLMLAGIRGNDYDTATAMMFAGILGAYTVRDIQSRTQVFKSIFFIFIGFIIPIVSFGLERLVDFEQTYIKLIISGINSAIAPVITTGLLFILERTTKLTTDLTLQEYNNLNHPLLVRMSDVAPGTYQHTIALATLAEKCASAVGANPLLAKVGAYFHDIGKIAKPEYYVENQADGDNKHSHLSPRKSAELIRNHVHDGLKLGEEYELPQRIVDFITMHHGTFLIKHFYAKALEEANGIDINEKDFRYPGPKPNNKETAIVMICDSAEAMSRIPNKDKDELEKGIARTISNRLADGQFDDCNLTLHELHVIKDTCVKYLTGISHPRMEYLEVPEKNDEPDIDDKEK